MNHEVKTIPDMLVKTRGNMSEVSRALGVTRATVYKYANDRDAKHHAIVNGIFMASQGKRGRE